MIIPLLVNEKCVQNVQILRKAERETIFLSNAVRIAQASKFINKMKNLLYIYLLIVAAKRPMQHWQNAADSQRQI